MTTAVCPSCGNQKSAEDWCEVCSLQLALQPNVLQRKSRNRVGDFPQPQELAPSFPALEIMELVGFGGMGAIYQARQTTLDRYVAIKLISREYSEDPAFVERLEREAKTLAKLSHPNIVTVYDFGQTEDGSAYLLMEFVEGCNLREAMSNRAFPSREAADLLYVTAKAIDFAHSKGIIHRDIKPENILISDDGTIKVVDFGIAKIIDHSSALPTLTATRQVLGSPHYLAPEQIEAPHEVDHRVDLYALGVVFYELLTGRLPLGHFEPPSVLVPGVDSRFDSIAMKLLSRKPSGRYQSASDLLRDLSAMATPVAFQDGHSSSAELTPEYSIPFTCEKFGGLAKMIGMIRFQANELQLEYRITDNLLGEFKSQMRSLIIPLASLNGIELNYGMFGGRLELSSKSISALGDLPQAETGRVALSIASKDLPAAESIMRKLQTTRAPNSIAMIQIRNPEPNNYILASLLFTFGLLNILILVLGMIYISNYVAEGTKAIRAVTVAMLLGPLSFYQIFVAILHVTSKRNFLTPSALLLTMLPISPLFPLGILFGLWAFRWMKGSSEPPASLRKSASSTSRSWSSTTMSFFRENFSARFAAQTQAVLIGLTAIILVGYAFGYYPSNLRMRVIPTSPRLESSPSGMQDPWVTTWLRERVENAGDLHNIRLEINQGQLNISSYKYQHPRILEQLAIPQSPQLIWLASSEFPSDKIENGQHKLVDLEAFQPESAIFKSLYVEQSALGFQALALSDAFSLTSIDCASVNVVGARKSSKRSSEQGSLQIELTQLGKEKLTQKAPTAPGSRVGLMINGVVVGIAIESNSSRWITFQCLDTETNSPRSLQAAIRGPDLPFQLEVLSK